MKCNSVISLWHPLRNSVPIIEDAFGAVKEDHCGDQIDYGKNERSQREESCRHDPEPFCYTDSIREFEEKNSCDEHERQSHTDRLRSLQSECTDRCQIGGGEKHTGRRIERRGAENIDDVRMDK